MKFKFGASYNVFDDSLELLEKSINCIRENIDFISVVYQDISNYGQKADCDIKQFLESLLIKNKIDEIVFFEPQLEKGPHFNEIQKRNIGLQKSINKNCNYHISLDSDEFYLKSEFDFLIDFINKNEPKSTYCQLRTYYKDLNFQISPPEEYYVSLFYKIDKNSTYLFGCKAPVNVDPTRKMYTLPHKLIVKLYKIFGVKLKDIDPEKNVIFSREQIEMHHMSYVRDNFRKKIFNSSALCNFEKEAEEIVRYFENYQFPQKALMAGKPPVYYDVIKTNYNWD